MHACVGGNFSFARTRQTASRTLLIHANARRTPSLPKWQLAPTMLMHATGCVSRSVSLPSFRPTLFWRLQVFPRASSWFKLRDAYFLPPDIKAGSGASRRNAFSQCADIFWRAPENYHFSPCRPDRYVLSPRKYVHLVCIAREKYFHRCTPTRVPNAFVSANWSFKCRYFTVKSIFHLRKYQRSLPRFVDI